MQKEEKHVTDEVAIEALRPFGTSIFTEMSVLANKHRAVNLSQGFPDFDGPEVIRQKAAEALVRGPNQYVLSYGIPPFREALARKMKRFYDLDVNPDTEITVTSGATEGLCATLMGIVETGDEVILLEPSYDSYAPVATMAKAKIRYVSLEGPEFSLPREKLTAAFNPRTKAILINNPQNPCCKTYSREELSFIGELCAKYDAYAIGDEVYEHLVYDGRKHVTLLDIPELKESVLRGLFNGQDIFHDRLEDRLRHGGPPSYRCRPHEPSVHHLLRAGASPGGHGLCHRLSGQLLP